MKERIEKKKFFVSILMTVLMTATIMTGCTEFKTEENKEPTTHYVGPPLCKIYGLNFYPFIKEGQSQYYGTQISEEQIRELITTIAPYTEWIRTYGCTDGLEKSGRIAHGLGLKIAVGAFLTRNLSANEEEISSLIDIAQAGEADMLIVGHEVMYRDYLTEDQLIEYINRVKENTSGIPIATSDFYREFIDHYGVTKAIDIVLANYYPYWEGASIDYAIYNIHVQHLQLLEVMNTISKTVMVSEAGWPSSGYHAMTGRIDNAVASLENAGFFFLNFISWANAENVSYFYDAFNQPHTSKDIYEQISDWGIWDEDGYLKPGMEKVFNCEVAENNWQTEVIDGPGSPTIEFTYVPPISYESMPSTESYNPLEGRVSHVNPANYRVAVYIYVNFGWRTKPYLDSPTTIILPDGSWICDITTGGVDYSATEIAAFLLPSGYDPPLMEGEYNVLLPYNLYKFSLAHINVTRSH